LLPIAAETSVAHALHSTEAREAARLAVAEVHPIFASGGTVVHGRTVLTSALIVLVAFTRAGASAKEGARGVISTLATISFAVVDRRTVRTIAAVSGVAAAVALSSASVGALSIESAVAVVDSAGIHSDTALAVSIQAWVVIASFACTLALSRTGRFALSMNVTASVDLFAGIDGFADLTVTGVSCVAHARVSSTFVRRANCVQGTPTICTIADTCSILFCKTRFASARETQFASAFGQACTHESALGIFMAPAVTSKALVNRRASNTVAFITLVASARAPGLGLWRRGAGRLHMAATVDEAARVNLDARLAISSETRIARTHGRGTRGGHETSGRQAAAPMLCRTRIDRLATFAITSVARIAGTCTLTGSGVTAASLLRTPAVGGLALVSGNARSTRAGHPALLADTLGLTSLKEALSHKVALLYLIVIARICQVAALTRARETLVA
jgi:hypothetical protein